jgi:tRNA nucleotidyltransferase/poly(A) polymerase
MGSYFTSKIGAINLTTQEEDIIKILNEAVKEKKPETVIRIAGGWVRDKLMGFPSDDIDISLNNCKGLAFAEIVNKYLSDIGHSTHSIGLIKSNPDKSKHLETATIEVMGISIDCVEMRSETYTEESRTPQIHFGTPEEDAMRRDFTINALFYNTSTRLVEDFTTKGHEDLSKGVIRTPLDPVQTFNDDPLRVLRAIRFSTRYGFSLEPSLIEAARAPQLREIFLRKISRERIRIELDKMLGITGFEDGTSSRPALALLTAYELDLFPVIFSIPEPKEHIRLTGTVPLSSLSQSKSKVKGGVAVGARKGQGKGNLDSIFEFSDEDSKSALSQWIPNSVSYIGWLNVILSQVKVQKEDMNPLSFFNDSSTTEICMSYTPQRNTVRSDGSANIKGSILSEGFTIRTAKAATVSLMEDCGLDSVSIGILYLAAALMPLKKFEIPNIKKKCMKNLSECLLRESLKVSNDIGKRVDAILSVQDGLVAILRDGCKRVDASQLLHSCKTDWKLALVLAFTCAVKEMHNIDHVPGLPLDPSSQGFTDVIVSKEVVSKISEFSDFIDVLTRMRLEEAWSTDPFFDGNELQKELGVKGAKVGKLIDVQFRWQVSNPSGSQVVCLAYLRCHAQDMGI